MYEVKIPHVVFRLLLLLPRMAFGPIFIDNRTGFCSIREIFTSHGLYCRAKILMARPSKSRYFSEWSKNPERLHIYRP